MNVLAKVTVLFMITIVNYGMGNLGSILNMLKKIGAKALVSNTVSDIEAADRLILPGVGAFDNGMRNLQERGLLPVLNRKVREEKTPILGICLGMQLLTKRSQEGMLPGLGWIDAETVRFQFNNVAEYQNLKIPHMGWNTISVNQPNSLFQELEENPRFYFVHSYHVVCHEASDALTSTHHGYSFTSSIMRENIMGVQFHPEKSHKYGMGLLRNFAAVEAE